MKTNHTIDLSDLLRLQIGVEFANYKQLCLFLRKPILGGTTKIAQLKVWEQQISFKRDKQKFIIEDIHPDVIPSTTKLTKDMQDRVILLLYHAVSKVIEDYDCDDIWNNPAYNTNDTIYKETFTLKELFTFIGACNTNFITSSKYAQSNERYKQDPILRNLYSKSIFCDIPYWEFLDFYAEVNTRGRDLIKDIMQAVNKSYLATLTKTYTIVTSNKQSHVATQEEYQAIRASISEVLNREKYQIKGKKVPVSPSEKDIFLKKQTKLFYNDVCGTDWFIKNGITNFYTVYELIFTGTLFARLMQFCINNNIHESLIKQLSLAKEASKNRTISKINGVAKGQIDNNYIINITSQPNFIITREFLSDVFYNAEGNIAFDYKVYLSNAAKYEEEYKDKIKAIPVANTFAEFLALAGGN